jgi:hypothetical protein
VPEEKCRIIITLGHPTSMIPANPAGPLTKR